MAAPSIFALCASGREMSHRSLPISVRGKPSGGFSGRFGYDWKMPGLAEMSAPKAGAGMAELEAKLEQVLRTCQAAWPAIRVEPATFMGKLCEGLPPGAEPLAGVGELAVRDLYLACGCAAGDPAALEAFERSVLSRVPVFVSRIDSSPAFADDVRDQVRDALLIARRGKPAGIGRYSGAGELGGFVRVVALRIALQLRRRRGPPSSAPLRPAADPELDYLKLRYRRDFEEAFASALGSLSVHEKLLLKLHSVDGLGVDRIAVMYRLHRSTAARQLAAIRRKLRERTQRELQERLSISPAEFESLLAVVRSQIWISVRGALATKNQPPPLSAAG